MGKQAERRTNTTQREAEETLRARAERTFTARQAQGAHPFPTDDPERLLHELQVHQIELEMQNEELRQAQEALLASQARYFDLYDLAPVGYLTLNEKGTIVEANLAVATLLSVPRRAVLRQRLTRFILAEDQDAYYLQVKQLTATDQPQQCEVRLAQPDGATRWVWLEMAPAHDDAKGAPPTLRVVLSDITARKQAEAERMHLQMQLAQAQKLELVGRLAGGIAHDFNNMLAVILMRAELALQGADPSTPLHRSLTAIHTTAQRSAELVRQLLGFARKQAIAPQALDLNAAVTLMLPMLQQLIGEEVAMIWRPGDELWLVKMDPAQLHQILANLCVNARDAIAGIGEVIIETRNTPVSRPLTIRDHTLPPGDYVTLTVIDNGSGITPAVLEHIFEPFFTTKGAAKGTGLGLATVDGIVQQNRGEIEVLSGPGPGTRMQIYLPRLAAVAETPAPAAPQELPRGHGETILLVEDEQVVLQMAHDALHTLGYQVLTAGAPGEALRLLAGEHPAVALLMTDIIMPEMNGRELAELIAAHQPQVKRLFVSGYPADFVAARGVMERGVHFLQKPYSLHALAVKVHEALL
jgi:PAS domain S-box-containing protein